MPVPIRKVRKWWLWVGIGCCITGLIGAAAIAKMIRTFHDPPPKPTAETKYVVAVLMHEPGHYTLLVVTPTSKMAAPQPLWICGDNPHDDGAERFLFDVADQKSAYVLITTTDNQSCSTGAEFHLRSTRDLEGAGWYHPMLGSGKTIVVFR